MNRSPVKPLPSGQVVRADFPRFGVDASARFEIPQIEHASIMISDTLETFTLHYADLLALERVNVSADFHCVTTWSYPNVMWSGFRFRDVYEHLIKAHLPAYMDSSIVVFRGLDRYKSSLCLEDVLTDDVLIADRLDGEPLSAQHGAPLRVVAPAHYGYKSVKHLTKIELRRDEPLYRSFIPRIMQHPRARIAYEERGRYLPGWVFRYLYRPLIAPTVRKMNP
jgi:DMSO/TMAO reductase YedYZ molybdopterin-dependent catalytic subunit